MSITYSKIIFVCVCNTFLHIQWELMEKQFENNESNMLSVDVN